MKTDASGCKYVDAGGRNRGSQARFKVIKRNVHGELCDTGIQAWPGNDNAI